MSALGRTVVTLVVLLGTYSTSASAQLGFLDKVFEKVSDVNVSYQVGRSLKRNAVIGDRGLQGIGFEVALSLGSFLETSPVASCAKPTYEFTPSTRERRGRDTTYTDTATRKDERPDSVKDDPRKKRAYDKNCDSQPSIDAEVALGYSQISGFSGRLVPLQGALEQLPAIGFYTVWNTGNGYSFYLGLRTGLAQLKGFQAFPSDTGHLTATGSTWQLGIAPGFSFGKPGFHGVLFVEVEWMYRRFDDIQWTAVTGPVPATLRGPIHLSTVVLSVGGQIAINP